MDQVGDGLVARFIHPLQIGAPQQQGTHSLSSSVNGNCNAS